MQEMQVPSLGWADPLEKEMANHSSVLAWKISWTEELASCSPWSCKELDMTEHTQQSTSEFCSLQTLSPVILCLPFIE